MKPKYTVYKQATCATRKQKLNYKLNLSVRQLRTRRPRNWPSKRPKKGPDCTLKPKKAAAEKEGEQVAEQTAKEAEENAQLQAEIEKKAAEAK